jgi:hypothetical protein
MHQHLQIAHRKSSLSRKLLAELRSQPLERLGDETVGAEPTEDV